ncbi:hypothetical protein L9F63_017870, partial [Diploptera punctata]
EMKFIYAICALLMLLMVHQTSAAGCAGCAVDADRNSEEIKKHAENSIKEIQKGLNTPYDLKLIEIESVTTQVVAGQLLKYKLIAGYDDPKANKTVKHRCTVEVWLKPWEDFEQTTVKGCENID